MFCSTENRITVWLFQIVNLFASNEQHLRQLFIYLFFFRSNRPEVFCKKGALRNFIKFTGKHLCQSLIFNKVLLKMRLWHRCFPMNFVKFLRTPFFIEHLWWLLLFFFFFFLIDCDFIIFVLLTYFRALILNLPWNNAAKYWGEKFVINICLFYHSATPQKYSWIFRYLTWKEVNSCPL